MKTLILIFFIVITLACKSMGEGRMGLHGMVLYGDKESYFLDHIPMEHAPHDLQVVTKVKLVDRKGKPVSNDFSQGTFTLKPSEKFSLDDYAAGKLIRFEGDIYFGGFEQDGRVYPGLTKVVVEVQQVVLKRQIPAESTQSSIQIEEFEINLITPEKNVQMIRNKTSGQILWCVKGPDFYEFCD